MCPAITVQASCHLERSGPVSVLEMGDVFGCVSMCCLRCVVGCVRDGVDALAVVWWRSFFFLKKEICNCKKNPAKKFFTITENIMSASNYEYYSFSYFEKIRNTHFCTHSAKMVTIQSAHSILTFSGSLTPSHSASLSSIVETLALLAIPAIG